jgi:hypothetical protein
VEQVAKQEELANAESAKKPIPQYFNAS